MTQLRFGLGACALGRVLVAWTPSGVREVALGDDAEALAADLLSRSPGAAPAPDLGPHGDVVLRALEGGLVDVPLDPAGTDFQRRVWDALRAIPPGQTRTYAELAEALGMPATGSRAVGTACGSNAIAVLIPCHRVVRADGDLAGFRWGVERKRALLEREGALRQTSLF
jgi:AraC family transcriptional regulator of adaptative response/methylated-DNA-[protein]-cysteine methyltransferase